MRVRTVALLPARETPRTGGRGYGYARDVNNDWAIDQLQRHVEMTTLSWIEGDMVSYESTAATEDEIIASAQIVEKIMDRVTPGWRNAVDVTRPGLWREHRAAAVRALAEIKSGALVAEQLGDNAPTLTAAAMHPWVWDGARSLWQSGHYGEAVRAASTKINAELQNKIGRRDVSEKDLILQAFSDEAPVPGRPRLRLPDEDGGSTAKSLRRGIRMLGEGCFAALRNPVSHDPIVDVEEVIALERLATLSLLARWIDEAEVQRA